VKYVDECLRSWGFVVIGVTHHEIMIVENPVKYKNVGKTTIT
jgi:hypothetical protein